MDSKTAGEILMLRRQAAHLAATHEPEIDSELATDSRIHRFTHLGSRAVTASARKIERAGNGKEISQVVEFKNILPFAPGIELHLIATTSKISEGRGQFNRVDSVETRLMDENNPEGDPLAAEKVSLVEVTTLMGDSAIERETLAKLADMEETLKTAHQYEDFLSGVAYSPL